jgi:predicted small metal-binding protein
MYEFSCQAAGAEGCGWKARATSEDELIAKVADHARTVHHVPALSNTLTSYARQVARQGAS